MNANAHLAAIIAIELSEKLAMIVGALQREPRMGHRWNLLKGQNLAAATARRYKTNGAPYRSPLLEGTDVLPP